MNQQVDNEIGGYSSETGVDMVFYGSSIQCEGVRVDPRDVFIESLASVGGGKVTNASSKACAPAPDLTELKRKADMADELADALEDLLNSCVVKHPQIKINARIRLANYRRQS